MTRRSEPYPAPGYGVRLPTPIWAAALGELRRYATLGGNRRHPGSEALVYLGGVVAGDEMVVTSLYVLDHAPQGGSVVVTDDEAKWLLRALRTRDEKLVGQVHSHRGAAGHSFGDDLHATSFHEGFLSIVVPGFGHDVAAVLECAVLEFRDGAFVDLDDDEVDRRLRVEPQIAFRAARAGTTALTDIHATPDATESRWSRFALRLRSTGRRRR
jgi:hypothetical protein